MKAIKTAFVLATAIFSLFVVSSLSARGQSTNEAVCKISAGSFIGSGTLIGASIDGKTALVISCYHVCGDYRFVNCFFKNVAQLAETPFPGRVVKLSRQWDLAAVLIFNPGIPPAEIGDFSIAHPGVYSACGYGKGRYSAARGSIIRMDADTIETRYNIYGGHSGGGLFDPWGRWCGVTNWSSNNRGPERGGFTMSRSGWPLEQFTREAVEQCGILSRLRNRGGGGGGGGSCPDGNCPNPSVPSLPGQGYAPGFQPLTPLASQPQQTPTVTTPPAVNPAPTITVPAPQPQQPPTVTVQQTPAVVQQQVVQTPPQEQQINALIAALEKKFGVKASTEPETGDAAKLLDDLPTVELNVVYGDRTEKATLDLRAFVLRELGAGEPVEEAK